MREISFFYFPGSTYTYLTVNRIETRAGEAGVTVRWRPYNLRLFLKESGTVPFPSGSSKEPLHVAGSGAPRSPHRYPLHIATTVPG